MHHPIQHPVDRTRPAGDPASPRPARHYGEPDRGALTGVRVLDLTMLLPGPLCTMHLADLGAEVVKVEHPVAVDGSRKAGPVIASKEEEMSAAFYVLNRNKKSITLNYRREEGEGVAVAAS